MVSFVQLAACSFGAATLELGTSLKWQLSSFEPLELQHLRFELCAKEASQQQLEHHLVGESYVQASPQGGVLGDNDLVTAMVAQGQRAASLASCCQSLAETLFCASAKLKNDQPKLNTGKFEKKKAGFGTQFSKNAIF